MRIRWTSPLARDLTHLCDYIEQNNGRAAARRVALAIYDSVDTLRQFPSPGRVGRVADTRELVVSGLPYLAIYRVRDSVIEIASVLDPFSWLAVAFAKSTARDAGPQHRRPLARAARPSGRAAASSGALRAACARAVSLQCRTGEAA